jgi:ABC-2 type transport system ATP-binding protein
VTIRGDPVTLQVEDLDVGYGDRLVLSGVRLDARAGEAVALLGANGAGKSTLLRCLAGLLRPRSGTVLVDGRAADDRDPTFRRTVASLLDDGAWYPNLTVAEHLELVQLANDPAPPEWFTAAELVERLDMGGYADAMPGGLSSGQRQRFALATVFARPSRLLLLDEPERHLDDEGRDAAGGLVASYCGRGGAALLATHDEELRRSAGARIVVIGGGHLGASPEGGATTGSKRRRTPRRGR